jgi:hypothetical protein
MRSATLLVFAKPPRIGLAKTRLAKGMGKAAARRIASFTLARTLRAAQASGCRVIVYVSPDRIAAQRGGQGAFEVLNLKPQGAGDLTARLVRGFREAPPGPVLFIGTDTPDINPARLKQAVRALRRNDAVLGPAKDGGFWLFGLHKGPQTKAPFNGVRWSGPHAMEDVWSRLPPRSRVDVLDQLIDIDEAADWKQWIRRGR